MNYIYIIGPKEPPYKIGYSQTPEKRLKSLQTGHPNKLYLHYVKEVSDANVQIIEKQIHKIINYKKTKGEWFDILLEDAISQVNFSVIRYD